jgi:hypothetical protein
MLVLVMVMVMVVVVRLGGIFPKMCCLVPCGDSYDGDWKGCVKQGDGIFYQPPYHYYHRYHHPYQYACRAVY